MLLATYYNGGRHLSANSCESQVQERCLFLSWYSAFVATNQNKQVSFFPVALSHDLISICWELDHRLWREAQWLIALAKHLYMFKKEVLLSAPQTLRSCHYHIKLWRHSGHIQIIAAPDSSTAWAADSESHIPSSLSAVASFHRSWSKKLHLFFVTHATNCKPQFLRPSFILW